MNCGLEPSLVCLDFEFTGALHLYMFPKKREKLCKIDLKNGSSLDKVLTKKKRKLIIVRDVSLTKVYWNSVISGTRLNHTSMMMKKKRKKTRKLQLKMLRNLLAKKLHSRKQKKYNQC